MRLALVQFNPTVGDITGNARRMISLCAEAKSKDADLCVFPELALVGYPPRDLLLQEGFVAAAAEAAKCIAAEAPRGMTIVFGTALPVDGVTPGVAIDPHRLRNSLLAYRDGSLVAYYDKRLLPSYDVFDEDRYFLPSDRPVVIVVPLGGGASLRVGLTICEDLWRGEDVGFAARYLDAADPLTELLDAPPGKRDGWAGPAQIIINPSASPFRLGTGPRHRELLARRAREHGVFVAGVNQVGANDELVFDGHAAVYDPRGRLIGAGPGFVEQVVLCDIDPHAPAQPEIADPLLTERPEALLFNALTLGVRDYCRKTGFKTAVLGLSGGIDSAAVAVLACAALGPANVLGISMPGPFSSQGSRDDAAALAARLGMKCETVPIGPGFDALQGSLKPLFAGRAEDVTEENLQSRLRGTILMAASNKFGHLLLTTGNKSELAVGYCTLYGDMNGGLAVISDLTKNRVYDLSRWMNAHHQRLGIAGLNGPPIPDASITKPPSAELRPNQTDQDSLPPYDLLDEMIDRYVERREHPRRIIEAMAGRADEATIRRVVRLIDLSEYKRKQAAIGLKVSSVAFGSGRRMPIAQGWRGGLS